MSHQDREGYTRQVDVSHIIVSTAADEVASEAATVCALPQQPMHELMKRDLTD